NVKRYYTHKTDLARNEFPKWISDQSSHHFSFLTFIGLGGLCTFGIFVPKSGVTEPTQQHAPKKGLASFAHTS
ncbi:MAG TPA: hypothetical protein VFD54_02735, partial [Anaerolineales bacterium]|nr:hypothetical protein [Anaerolineales bacterium]